MTNQKDDSYRLMKRLALAITLPMILLSGPLAGFLIGHMVLVKQFGMTPLLTPILMVVGLIGSAIQAVRVIQRLKAGN